jgi:hypothetical protein
MARTLAEGYGVHTITACEMLNEATSLLHGTTPIRGLIIVEPNWPAHMAACIQQQPTGKRRRIRMMSKDPQWPAANFIEIGTALISMKATNIAGHKIGQVAGV